MPRTLLQLVQEVAPSVQLPVPSTVTGALDDATLQVWKIFNEGQRAMSDEYEFQQLINYNTFQHINGLDSLAVNLNIDGISGANGYVQPNPFKFLVPDTLWSVSDRRQVAGPLTLQQWNQLKIFNVANAIYSYMISQQGIHIFPVPSPLSSVTFGYYYGSRCSVTLNGPDAGSYMEYVTDNAKSVLPDQVVLADFKWRWKREKGLAYAEDKEVADQLCKNEVGRDNQGTIDMAGEQKDAFPQLYVPTFNSVGHP
jgi:hypothetical protein